MRTYKISFMNTSNKIDFYTIDSESESEAVYLFLENVNAEIISTEDVTDKFVDSDGTIKPLNYPNN